MGMRVNGLDPIVGDNPRVLVLGTFPGESSRIAREYYHDESNRFWKIINRVLNNNQGFLSYSAKKRCLLDHQVALWDIYETKLLTGESSDKGIKDPTFNDLKRFLSDHPTIERIVFNGLTEPAYEFVRIVNGIPRDMCVFLRQTSGSAATKLVDYLDSWGDALTKL